MDFFSYEEEPLCAGQFRVDTCYRGFSAGTELTFVKGSNPYLNARWDEHYGLFLRCQASIRYPVPFLGYTEVGRITKKWAGILKEGFTTADNYILNVSGEVSPDLRLMMLASAAGVDVALKQDEN